jgi:hypothetical protein
MADVVLDYNQVIEETPVTGDTPPSSGGLVTFQFKCDVNGATDLSNTFFAADVQVASVHKTSTSSAPQYIKADGSGLSATSSEGIYIPDAYDFHAFPMLRCFQSITHIIDGQTVCSSQHPYADALLVEKFLTTHSKANLENFQALSLCKQIDNGVKAHNIFTFDSPAMVGPRPGTEDYSAWAYDWAKPGMFRQKYASDATTGSYPALTEYYGTNTVRDEELYGGKVTTMLFQPPFDLWRLRQPMHGGIHQIQLNLKASDGDAKWGGYMTTSCVGLTRKLPFFYDMHRSYGLLGSDEATKNSARLAVSSFGGANTLFSEVTGRWNSSLSTPFMERSDLDLTGTEDPTTVYLAALNAAKSCDRVMVDIKRLRLLRRVIRTSVPPQLSNVQYNFTEISMQHGTPVTQGVSQQFLLPSTTFGLVFYWREATNTDFDQINVHPNVTNMTTSSAGVIGGTSLFFNDDAGDLPVGQTVTGLNQNELYQLRNVDFDLHDFQFTYGGATYPMQRIQRVTGNKGSDSSNPYGWHRIMALQNQLQGVYNSTMDDFPQSYGHGYGKGVLSRMDPHMMFFPVSRTGNSDNGILQVEYTCRTRQPSTAFASEAVNVQLVVCALYDAQLNMQYSSNELQQIVLTQFK